MARTDELKRRVERLVEGRRNTGDLHVLFLWLRERSFGNKIVADLGDFVAHSEDRDRGVAWRGTRHFHTVLQFILPRSTANSQLGTMIPLPRPASAPATVEQMRAAAWATFETADAAEIRRHTGLGKRKARVVLETVLSIIVEVNGTELLCRRAPTEAEHRTLQFFTTTVMARPAYTSEALLRELWVCLQKNRLVTASDTMPKELGEFVSLFALERMHLAQIALDGGKTATLEASPDSRDNFLHVDTVVPIRLGDRDITVRTPIYMTDLKADAFCEAALIAEPNPWNFPLELGPLGKLQKL